MELELYEFGFAAFAPKYFAENRSHLLCHSSFIVTALDKFGGIDRHGDLSMVSLLAGKHESLRPLLPHGWKVLPAIYCARARAGYSLDIKEGAVKTGALERR